MRAAIYARVSSQAQKDRHTIENQLRVLPAFVTSQGWLLVGTYIDDGRSAKAGKLDARGGFAELLRDAEAKKFDLLVVVDVDRLTRTDSMEERTRILGPFQRLGIDIVTPSGGRLDMRTMFGELWITIQALGAAEENRKRAERIKAGKARAIAEGRKPAGPTPYGLAYSRATGRWSIDELAAVIVREIFERVIAGEACRTIAEQLARRGAAPTPRKGWSQAAVYRIVRNRSSCGYWDADKKRGAVIRVPAVVDERTWQEAQRSLMLHRRRGLRKTRHVYLLEGIARCSCGGRIDIRSACGGPKKNQPAYVCRNRKLKLGCGERILKCPDVDARVWAALCDELVQPDLLAALAEINRRSLADDRDWLADVIAHKAEITRLDVVEEQVMIRFRRGTISERTLDIELKALNRDRAFTRRQLDTAAAAIATNEASRDRAGSVEFALASLRAALPEASPEDRRALVRELIDDGGVIITNGRAHLDLRISILGAAASRDVDAVPRIGLVGNSSYRTHHDAIASLRVRRVA